MAKNATPVSTGARLKAAREAARAKREQEKADLIAENARLKAELSARPALLSGGSAVPITFTPVDVDGLDLAKRKEQPNQGTVVPKDDLDYIDGDLNAVYLVSKNMSITLRPVNPDVHPIVQGVNVHAFDSGPWIANPYNMRSGSSDHEERAAEEKLNAVKYANWGYFVISRQLAESVYGDPRNPIPQKAIISSKEFKGYDRNVRRSQGTYRDLGPNPDPLRECVRSVLQRLDNTYVDASRHYDLVAAMKMDPRTPNPYRRGLGGLSLKAPVIPIQREGMTS